MKQVTREEWRKCHKDYKVIRDGGKWMMFNSNIGAVLRPVEIIKESKNK